jgi:hypothetical protein
VEHVLSPLCFPHSGSLGALDPGEQRLVSGEPLKRGFLMNKRVAEFFAGIGLMRMGLERGGWDTVWANDIDQKKGEMYRTHYGEGSDDFVIGDVHAVAVSAMPDVELATASFPCNDLSLAGSRNGLAGGGLKELRSGEDLLDDAGGLHAREPVDDALGRARGTVKISGLGPDASAGKTLRRGELVGGAKVAQASNL